MALDTGTRDQERVSKPNAEPARTVLRKILIAMRWIGVAVAVTAGVFVYRLIHVGQPDKGTSLEFRGFVLLPKGAFLTVLDYLTVSDQRLFVTNESTGSVYKIA